MPPPRDASRAAVVAVPFARGLALHGDAPAVITDCGSLVSYRDLAARVGELAERLGDERRLVLVAGANTLDALVAYLAALAAGHPALLAAGDDEGSIDALTALYDPDVIVGPVAGEWRLDQRREGSAHALHPELALLLSTSGSTGSPKLVRLSHENLTANAESIARYLAIRDCDRAATTLPMHYCYGLSVVNSHLLRGAALILTDRSVLDTRFWELFREARGTALAGVPYTFDLLDRIGFADMHLPSLRYVTQAGGRLAPERVRRYAALGRARGWDLFVMYGQTEATARMAYLPPDRAHDSPGAIGVPIPGGSFTLEPVPDADDPAVGELVYRGPNVMLGYARTPADLARGRAVERLHTGDLARRTADGLYELVGRRARFAKLFGLRIDLDRVEAMLAAGGLRACCVAVEDDHELIVAVEGDGHDDAIRRRAATDLGLPSSALSLLRLDAIPRKPSGKIDRPAVERIVREVRPPASDEASGPPGATASPVARDLCAVFSEVLERSDVTESSTFVDLGGDSLSYVEMSLRLEESLGHLPVDWHTTAIGELARAARRRTGIGREIETSVLLRAIAIVLIVATHVHLVRVVGGAHVLIAVAGFNYARFQLGGASRLERLARQLMSIARIALPAIAWIAIALLLLTDDYGLANLFLLGALVGPEAWTAQWHFWFVEVLVLILVVMAVVMAVPWIDRAERRRPFGFVVVLLGVGLAMRFDVVDLGVPHTLPVFWLFALGWAAARCTEAWQRACLTAVVLAVVPGFFGDIAREAVIAGGIVVLLWLPRVRIPALPCRLAAVLAASSLYIYLTHWQVYPLLEAHPLPAVLASLVAGVLAWTVAGPLIARLPAAWPPRWIYTLTSPSSAAPASSSSRPRPSTGPSAPAPCSPPPATRSAAQARSPAVRS